MTLVKRTTQFANVKTTNFIYNGKDYTKIDNNYAICNQTQQKRKWNESTLVTEITIKVN